MKFWENYTEEQLNNLVESVFLDYRKKGFPYVILSEEEKIHEWDKLKNYCNNNLVLSDKIIKQTMHGLSLAWCYFPHHWDVRCNNFKTPKEVFDNDDLFKKAIRKRLKYGTYLSDSGIRKTLKTFSGTMAVSNFRPSAANAIYKYFGARRVWDMSCGWGGRLLGASSAKIEYYLGTEPSTRTFNGLENLTKDLKNIFSVSTHFDLHCLGSEDLLPEKESLDLCFTSFPYFDTEKYADEPTQSFIKFKTKHDWAEGFLRKTLEHCYYGLQNGGFLCVNIANVNSFLDLESSFVQIAKQIGFTYMDTFKYSLSSIIGTKSSVGSYKYEPVFIFKK